jgi:glycosyltransferase involved in cell wall biosynthesis
MSYLVSAIVPVHNQAQYVDQAIESVLRQVLPVAEIIVVDDGSTDSTPEVLERYRQQIRVIRQHRQGVAAARNAGVRIATGDLLAFLDADDIWLPSKLARQVELFYTKPQLGLVHCGLEEIDSNGTVFDSRIDGLAGWVADEMLLFRRSVILGGGSGAVVSRVAFERIGGFDTKMSTSADWDAYYRIARRFEVGFVPEVLLRYRVHGANMHWNIAAMEHDMLSAYAKAFERADLSLGALRRRSFGNLHMVLAGSYFRCGQFQGFARNALKSLVLTPDNVTRLIGYPARFWRRRQSKQIKSPPTQSEAAQPLG